MESLIAIKSFRYNRRALKPGDIFEATPRDARVLCDVIKKAKTAPRAKAMSTQGSALVAGKTYERTDMRAGQYDTRSQPDSAGSEEAAADVGTGAGASDALAEKTKAELIEIAETEGIAYYATDRKAEILARIIAARAAS
jgi:hypothetical protein